MTYVAIILFGILLVLAVIGLSIVDRLETIIKVIQSSGDKK